MTGRKTPSDGDGRRDILLEHITSLDVRQRTRTSRGRYATYGTRMPTPHAKRVGVPRAQYERIRPCLSTTDHTHDAIDECKQMTHANHATPSGPFNLAVRTELAPP